MPPPPKLSLPELAASIATKGPSKQEPTNRRVRALFSGKWLLDTTDAVYVWEHPYYPQFYVPLSALTAGPAEVTRSEITPDGYWLGFFGLDNRYVDVAGFVKGPLEGLVKISSDSIDSWFVEDERQLGPHPKDPYKRIECIPSTREVRVELAGVPVARSVSSVFLFESLLQPRYYLPRTAVADWSALRPSETTTFCPYKGQASYYHLSVSDADGKAHEVRDAVWYYPYPTAESAPIQDRLCFYSERLEVYVEGKRV